MNTRASVAYGWGVLVAAGGGAYFFAKRSINADRQARAEAEEKRREAAWRLRYNAPPAEGQRADGHADPGHEAHEGEMAPAAGDEAPDAKYESARPFRSPKGDRFS